MVLVFFSCNPRYGRHISELEFLVSIVIVSLLSVRETNHVYSSGESTNVCQIVSRQSMKNLTYFSGCEGVDCMFGSLQ